MISFFALFLLPLTLNFALTKRSGTRIAPPLSRDCLALGLPGFWPADADTMLMHSTRPSFCRRRSLMLITAIKDQPCVEIHPTEAPFGCTSATPVQIAAAVRLLAADTLQPSSVARQAPSASSQSHGAVLRHLPAFETCGIQRGLQCGRAAELTDAPA